MLENSLTENDIIVQREGEKRQPQKSQETNIWKTVITNIEYFILKNFIYRF